MADDYWLQEVLSLARVSGNRDTAERAKAELAALRARVAELEAALRHIADSGTDYDSPAWASRRAAQALGVAGNKPAQRTPSQSATDIQLNGCRLHGRQDCKTC